MESRNNLLLTIAFVAVMVSVLAAGVSYFSVASLVTRISGFATGEANLTVESSAVINFTTNSINWGSGRVNDGADSAELLTVGSGSVSRGNWTAASGFIIENIGNNNVSLNLSVGKTAAQFLGGTNPGYEWNVTNVEANSCLNATCNGAASGLNVFSSTSTSSTQFCGCFGFVDSSDTIRVDLNVTIPSDSSTGSLGDVITSTIVAI